MIMEIEISIAEMVFRYYEDPSGIPNRLLSCFSVR